jgi:hypothetical protein
MSRIAKEYVEHQRKRWTRHDAWRFLPPRQLYEHKYSPDQPRVPAGVREGGRWSRDGVFDVAGKTPPGLQAFCDKQYKDDVRLCNLVQSPACYNQAQLRYGNCIQGLPTPDLRW